MSVLISLQQLLDNVYYIVKKEDIYTTCKNCNGESTVEINGGQYKCLVCHGGDVLSGERSTVIQSKMSYIVITETTIDGFGTGIKYNGFAELSTCKQLKFFCTEEEAINEIHNKNSDNFLNDWLPLIKDLFNKTYYFIHYKRVLEVCKNCNGKPLIDIKFRCAKCSTGTVHKDVPIILSGTLKEISIGSTYINFVIDAGKTIVVPVNNIFNTLEEANLKLDELKN